MNSTVIPADTATGMIQQELKDVNPINYADTCWIAISTCLVFIMIPGLGYFYGGITHRKNLLTSLLSTALGLAVVSVCWYIWGYSLSFSQSGSVFIGDLSHAFMIGVGANPHPNAPTIPSNLYFIYQGMFAAITPCLAFGSAAGRTTIQAYLIFLFFWTTLVYNFITYWCWGKNGWLRTLGVLDYAGGTPVHICSGFSALAYALAVGPRKTVDHATHKPSNVSDIFLGTGLLWFGWFGFNGGSEVAINARAVNAIVVSNIAASFGGLAWMFTEMVFHRTHKMSLVGFCSGAVAGLVCVTPGSGYVSPHYAVVFGIAAGVICFFACFIKKLSKYRYDDACDVFAVHGVGGAVGCFLTGVFAETRIATMSGGDAIPGGWVDGNWIQVCYQLLSISAPAGWAFVFTFAILLGINLLPFMRLKLTPEEEELGTDWVTLGEVAYGHDIPIVNYGYETSIVNDTKELETISAQL